MKVILLKGLGGLGKPYDVVEVRDGYARNYLLPRKLAMAATDGNIKGLEKSRKRFSKQMDKARMMSMDIAERINNLSVKTTLKTGMDGKTFGSITSADLAALLLAEGIEVDKKDIILKESLKHPGIYDIRVHLGEKVDAVFKLAVLEQGV
ncbi:50S ribosomal protein L9 [candidate division WOR-3 bacterium]|nr:50S ribosomal protein L9 [candidate division WOR-3 bacterium]